MSLKIENQAQLGKLPPQAIEIEELVLGGIINNSYGILQVSDFLMPEMFYRENHQKIYKAILELSNLREGIDMVTVGERLRKNGELESIGGNFYLVELISRVDIAANLMSHGRIIQQHYIMREVIRISSEYAVKGYDNREDALDLVDAMQTEIFGLMAGTLGRGFTTAADLIPERLKEYEKKPDISGITGISSGIKSLDDITGGWQKSDLVILAARPSMGKTAFALHCAREAAIKQNVAVGIFSLEMSKEQLVDRMIAAEAGISVSDIKKRNLHEAEFLKIHKEINGLLDSKILIDDTPGLSTGQMRAKAMRMKQTHNIGMLVVDYLGLMRADGNRKNSNRTNDIGDISRGLKGLAKELDIPVLALSQLSRKVEDRPGNSRKPRLSDLRDSGDIEQDADMVVFLYRPEYYDIMEDENGNSTENQCWLMIEKHRQGDLGTPYAEFKPAFMQFQGWNESKQAVQFQINAFEPPSNFRSYGIRPSQMTDGEPPF